MQQVGLRRLIPAAISKQFTHENNSNMPPKKAAASGAAKKPRAPKGGHVLAAPIPAGEVLTDNHKKQWRIGKPVGSGGFGLLYLGAKADEKTDQYVIKVEPHANGPLFCELHFYMRVGKPDLISSWMSSHKLKSLGVPKYIASGAHERNGTKYRFMVMERFGSDLQKLFEENGKRFPLKTVFQLAIRIIDALEYIHNNSYVHADIKASNLLLGYTAATAAQVFLVDYGLAFRYTTETGHKEYKEDPRRAHDGTIEFTSTDAHRGVLPARRGDLEILGYCLLQWLCGTLPWEDKLNNKEYVAEKKFKYAKDVPGLMRACFPKGDGPDALRDFMKYVMNLEYTEEPDYTYLRQIFKNALKKNGFSDDAKLVFEASAPKAQKKTPAKKASKIPESSTKEEMSPASPKKKGIKRQGKAVTSDSEDDFSPEPAKKTARRGGSPKKKAKTPVARVKSSPLKRVTSPKGTPKARAIPFPPIGSRGPPINGSPLPKKTASPVAKKAKTNTKSKAKTSRVATIKTSVATQTSPGLKGLRRSRKT